VLLTGALGSGLLDLLSANRLTVRGPAGSDSIERFLADVLDAPRTLITMPVGPARANRKPVLQVTDLSGNVLAFAKIGHDDLTRALVDSEGRTLRRLGDAALRHIRVPRVIAHTQWRDLAVLVLEPLPVSARQERPGPARAGLLTAIAEISALSSWRGSWADNPFHVRLRAALAVAGPHGTDLLGVLDAVGRPDPAVALGSWHGDLNPGNVAIRHDQVLVWDWERFEDGVPLGFDLLHHDLQRAITVEGIAPAAAAEQLLTGATGLLGVLGLDRQAAQAAARLYLLTIAARYLGDNQERAGATLGRVADWILPALRSAPAAD